MTCVFKVTLQLATPGAESAVYDCLVDHASSANFNGFTMPWLGSRVAIVLDSRAGGPGFESQPRRCRVTVLGKLFTPIVTLYTKQRSR